MAEPATPPDGPVASASAAEPEPVAHAALGSAVQRQPDGRFEVQPTVAIQPISTILAAASVNVALQARAHRVGAPNEPAAATRRRAAPSSRRAGPAERPGSVAAGSLGPSETADGDLGSVGSPRAPISTTIIIL